MNENLEKNEEYQRILNMPLDPTYKPVKDIPIPTQNGVLIKKIEKSLIEAIPLVGPNGEKLNLYAQEGENSQEPSIGIVVARGPECPKWVRKGLRYYYDCRMDQPFRHGSEYYVKMDHYALFFVIPDPSTIEITGVKDDRQMMREKQTVRNATANKHRHIEELNQMDMETEIKKKLRKK